jgi:hypothetical protein
VISVLHGNLLQPDIETNGTPSQSRWRDVQLAVVAFDIALADLAKKGQTGMALT